MNGEKNPDIKFDNEPKEIKRNMIKEDIMFKIDEDGKAIAEKVEVKIYDRVLDDELMLTTMELDNALTMHESTKKALDVTIKSMKESLLKLNNTLIELNKLDNPNDKEKNMINQTSLKIKELDKAIEDLSFKTTTQLTAFLTKINECREDIKSIEIMISEQTKTEYVELIPCTVSEAHKYFTKHKYKNDKCEWVNPENDEDVTWITKLLSEKVINPKLTEQEWEYAKPQYRLSLKETISSISGYNRISPREYLIEKRRSERLKNIEGEC